MLTINEKNTRKWILHTLGTASTQDFDSESAIRNRINFLKFYILQSNTKGLVLGISGGVDSTVAGKLAQIAVQELRDEGYDAQFIAILMPYKIQKDFYSAEEAIQFIKPDRVLDINIGNSTDSLFDGIMSSLYHSCGDKDELSNTPDFAKGNVKARMRMTTQYAIASMFNCLVLGSDNNAEAVTGFFTKHGDGACDLLVLNDLNKRQVRLCAKTLGASEQLWNKVATADLEDDKPQVSDEEVLGLTYDEIDDFLEGEIIDVEVARKIIQQYNKTGHKRRMPDRFFIVNEWTV